MEIVKPHEPWNKGKLVGQKGAPEAESDIGRSVFIFNSTPSGHPQDAS